MTAGTISATGSVRRVLRFLAGTYHSDFGFWPFAPIARQVKLSRAEVRRACRSLARKGLVEFKSGLWTEDGFPGGSGYGATKAGYELIYPPEKEAAARQRRIRASARLFAKMTPATGSATAATQGRQTEPAS